jgi:hypothetical protein
LELRDGKDEANLRKIMQSLASKLPNNSLEKFRKIHEYNDETVNRHLRVLVDPNSDTQQKRQAKEAVWNRINQSRKTKKDDKKKSDKKHTYWKYLLRKLTITFIGMFCCSTLKTEKREKKR